MMIVFEGLDGAGKSTAMESYAELLREKGYNVLITYEPGGTENSAAIRSVVKTTPLTTRTQSLLMAAARIENHDNGVLGQYAKRIDDPKTILLCDRYDASTYVYQGLMHDPIQASVYERIAEANYFLRPDLYVFFDVSYEDSRTRRTQGYRNADVEVTADVLERNLESKSKFTEMRDDYCNFFVSKQLSADIPYVTIDTTGIDAPSKMKVLTEKLNEYLVPISECARS